MFHQNMVEWIVKQMNYEIGDIVRFLNTGRVGYVTHVIRLGNDVCDISVQWFDEKSSIVPDESVTKLN